LAGAGYKVWIDKQIRPGNDWRAEIAQAKRCFNPNLTPIQPDLSSILTQAISNSQAVIFLVSQLSVQSKYCAFDLILTPF